MSGFDELDGVPSDVRPDVAATDASAAAGPPEAASPPRLTRRRMLGLSGALGAAVAGGAAPASAGHRPSRPTPDRPPPAHDLFSTEETRLAFRNDGFHLEYLDRPITPLGSHFLLIHFDIPQLSAEGYSIEVGGRVRNPTRIGLDELKQAPAVRQPTILECAGVGRSYLHPVRSTCPGSTSRSASTSTRARRCGRSSSGRAC